MQAELQTWYTSQESNYIWYCCLETNKKVKGDWDFQISDLAENPDGTDI